MSLPCRAIGRLKLGALAVVVLACLAVPAAGATISGTVSFLTQDGEHAGGGAFAYDPDTEAVLCARMPCSLPSDFLTVSTDLETFSARIFATSVLGEEVFVDFSSEQTAAEGWWWAEPGPGMVAVHRGGPFLREGSWFFGDPFFGERQLSMDFLAAISPESWTGSWVMTAVAADLADGSGTAGFAGASGSFIASAPAVPEPGAALLFAAGSLLVGRRVGREAGAGGPR